MNHTTNHTSSLTASHAASPVTRWRTVLIVLSAIVAVFTIAGPSGASAAPDIPDDSGWARFGHFAPSEGDVDFYVDGELAFADIGFKRVSDYLPLSSGPHQFVVRAAGQPDSEPISTVEAGVPNDASITIGAVSTRDGVATQVYTDELVQPAADGALVRFIHAAPDSASVDVNVVDGPTLAEDVAYPTATSYDDIAPGQYSVEVRDSASDQLVLTVEDWAIEPGTQATIVFVRGTDGNVDVAPVRDSFAAPVAPSGGIQTGGGAMADILDPVSGPPSGSGSSTPLVLTVAMLGLVVVSGLTTARVAARKGRS